MAASVPCNSPPSHQSLCTYFKDLHPPPPLPLRVLIISHSSYWKGSQLDFLPWLLHSISRFPFFKRKKKKDHVTSQIESLHSLPSTHTIKPKLLSITSKVFQTLVPPLTVSCHLPQCSCHPELNVWQIGQVPLTSNSSYKPESFFPPMILTESQLSFKIQLKCNTSARSSCSWLP